MHLKLYCKILSPEIGSSWQFLSKNGPKDHVVFQENVNDLIKEVVGSNGSTTIENIPSQSEVDLIYCGPPCQSFSRANSNKTPDDPRHSLSMVALSFVDWYRPQYFMWVRFNYTEIHLMIKYWIAWRMSLAWQCIPWSMQRMCLFAWALSRLSLLVFYQWGMLADNQLALLLMQFQLSSSLQYSSSCSVWCSSEQGTSYHHCCSWRSSTSRPP